MVDRHGRENVSKMWTEDKAREEANTKTVLSTVLHTVMEAAAYPLSWITQLLQTKSDIVKESELESENEKTENGDDLSNSEENSRHGTLEEMSEPDAGKEIQSSLKKLVFHLQISLKKKLDVKRKECTIRWEESSNPEIIIRAVREINQAIADKKWKDFVQKTNATLEMIEALPPNELPEKQELLMNIYSYFSPTYVENWDITKTIGYHDKDWIIAIEKLMKTLPDEKYPYEAALLHFEITMRYLALQKSFEDKESFKCRSLSAAKKAKDQELQLFGTILFVLAEWMSTTDIGPAKQRERLFTLGFSMERSLQLAQCLGDRVATDAIQTIVQQVEILCKRPYPKEIDHWMRRKQSRKIKYHWMKAHPNRRQLPFFDNGEILTKDTIFDFTNPDGKIIKVGASSGVTSSNVSDNGRVAIKIREAELLHRHGHIFPPIIEGTRSYFMKEQYVIRSRSNDVFLIEGDSGSGVFYIDQSQRLRCIGIAIGFLSNTYEAVVTPIENVLRALGLEENALMRFPV